MIEKIGNVTLDYTFYKGSDDYSDGDIENELLDYVKNNMNSEENEYDKIMNILKGDNRWPILYHLSPVRQNIIDWYDFKENSSVLEIGAGCGAVSGAICKQAGKVTSVELSKRRAMINAYRNHHYDNLNIMVGNFNNITFHETYDYITLIGVLEYANYFTGGDDSFVSFLKNIKRLLKPDGKLLIAIENKFGMKYFAGQVEDHTGQLFDGIEGYIGTDSKVRTFSKKELRDIVTEAGLSEVKYFYPFPDYKFPIQVFSDDYLPNAEDLVCSLDSYDNDRIRLFDETAAFAGIVNAKQFDFFSNSFFVEAGMEQISQQEAKIYSKITKDRKKEYQIETSIYINHETGECKAIKKAMTPEAKKHIQQMNFMYCKEEEKKNKNHFSATLCKSKYDDEKLYFEFVKGNSFCDMLLDALKAGNCTEFEKLLFEYENMVYEMAAANIKDTDLKRIEEAEGLNIDLTFDNIIEVRPGEYKIIDYEWCIQEKTSVKFVLYRAVYAFYMRYQDTISKYYTLNRLFEILGIQKEEEKDFYNRNLEFIDYVYDSKNGYNEVLKAYKMNTIEFEQRVLHHENFAQLFIDSGNGFSEDNSMKYFLKIFKDYQILKFNVSGKDIKALRFDPFNLPAVVKIKEIEAEYKDGSKAKINILNHNASAISTYSYLFENSDPQTFFSLDGIQVDDLKTIIIKLKLVLTNFKDYSEIFRLQEIRGAMEFQQENKLLDRVFSEIEKNKEILPDIHKYYTVTKKMVDMENEKPNNEKGFVTLTDTFVEETQVFINEMINLAYLREDMEKQLRQAILEKDKMKEELEYIKGTKLYKHFLDKKVSKEFHD